MYEKAKDEALTKLGLDPSYFSEEFDAYGENIKEQVNAMGEETRMNLDASYYNAEKTEYTVDHRTVVSNSTHNANYVKDEGENTHYEMGTHVPDRDNFNQGAQSHNPNAQSNLTGYNMNNYGGGQTT